MKTELFCRFAQNEAEQWRILALDYLHLCRDKYVSFYEDIKQNQEKELRRFLKFFRVVPLEEKRFDCLRRHPMNKHHRRRKDRGKLSIFYCSEARETVERAVEEVRNALLEHMLVDLPLGYSAKEED